MRHAHGIICSGKESILQGVASVEVWPDPITTLLPILVSMASTPTAKPGLVVLCQK